MRRKDREITDIKEIESIIQNSDVCRIAFANDNYPYLVTLNFGYRPGYPGKLYFHCSGEGKKIVMLEKNNYVCFELDSAHRLYDGPTGCDFGMSFQSVVGYGHITVITDDEEKKEGLNIIMEHYTGQKDFFYKPGVFNRTYVLRLDITEITGKKC